MNAARRLPLIFPDEQGGEPRVIRRRGARLRTWIRNLLRRVGV